ncbi:MAG: YybH family protein [Luminiphilus sp.]
MVLVQRRMLLPIDSMRWVAIVMTALACLSSVGSRADEPSDLEFFSQLVAEKYVEPFESGQVERWVSAFAENAVALHNRREPDRGRENIEQFAKAVHTMFDLAEYDVAVTDVRRNGTWAYTVGTYTSRFLFKEGGDEVFGREHGKFVLLWQLSSEGEWEIILDMGNSNS